MIIKSLIGCSAASAVGMLTAIGIHAYNHFIYDKYGYNKQGIDKANYNHRCSGKDEFDRNRYDFEVYCKSGIDKPLVNQECLSSQKYDEKGYDRSGIDRQGYYKSGYNSEGIDRGEKSFVFYIDEVSKINDILKKAYIQMKNDEYEEALNDIRIGFEKGVRCIIVHWKGSSYIKEDLGENISVCKRYDLLPQYFIDEVYDAKNHCDSIQHDEIVQIEYGHVHFTYKVLEELNEKIKSFV